MTKRSVRLGAAGLAVAAAAWASGPDRVRIASGTLEGEGLQGSGVRVFRGIPFAQPPLGDLRWKPPAPPRDWTGVREAKGFGPRCMQLPLYGDMNFHSNGMSEDCLYLNVWTPAKTGREKLPVLVYFFGGGFRAGDGSEPRYDGASMAAKGIVALTVNYRLDVFGFFAHPGLTKESPHHASGNYGLLDQNAALVWVQKNIAAFGGDPKRVTIAGESAGSIAVSALMASPLSRDLIAGAIGESGSILGTLPAAPLAEVEEQGLKLATALGVSSLSELRALPAQQILDAAGKPGSPRFSRSVDGYFFPEAPIKIFEAGKQAHVPLLAGWNSEEQNGRAVLGRDAASTRENLENAIQRLYGENAAEVQKAYAARSDDEAAEVATALASDRFIAYSTWKWIDIAGKTGGKPVYRYYYSRPRPQMTAAMGNATPGLAGGVIRSEAGSSASAPPPARGASHSAEIEYAMGNLGTNKVYEWTQDDYKVSSVMEEYFANFVKSGNPNGEGLPNWPASNSGSPSQLMHIDVTPRAEPETHRDRYLVLDRLAAKP